MSNINDVLNKNKEGILLFYYKGTCFPITTQPHLLDNFAECALSMIKDGLKMGDSLEEQKKYYKEQLDTIENTLCKTNNDPIKASFILNKEIELLQSTWILNILALLKLKVIKNDEMNGYLIIKQEGKIVSRIGV